MFFVLSSIIFIEFSLNCCAKVHSVNNSLDTSFCSACVSVDKASVHYIRISNIIIISQVDLNSV